MDAFCGVGGNAIQFAFTCERVIAIDLDPTRLACARHNAEIYGVAERIEFVLGDYTVWAREYARRMARGEVREGDRVEVVFLSPPWGGLDYLKLGAPPTDPTAATEIAHDEETRDRPYPLSALAPLPGDQLFALSRAITPHVAYYLPRNVDLDELAELPRAYPRTDGPAHTLRQETGEEEEVIEVEEERMSGKLKAVTVYFGDLATTAATAAASE